MGVEPFLIASTVRVVVAQRLVRRLCSDCRESYSPDATVLKQLDKSFRLSENGGFKRLHELENQRLKAASARPPEEAKVPTNQAAPTASITRLWKAHDGGCDNCNHSGYKGRIGIYEVLDNTEDIQKMIVTNSTSEAIQKAAIEAGMITMHLDGLVKALRGQTSVEEVLRVTTEE